MSARKLIYWCMVCAPAAFLVALGVHARYSTTDYEFVSADAGSEQRTLAYVPYLRASKGFLSDRESATFENARCVARLWIEGADRGELKPLAPVAYEDTSTEGAKAQVFEVERRIATKLLTGITKSLKNRQFHSATQDAILVVKLCNIAKYSDFISLFNNATMERRLLTIIEPSIPDLDQADRRNLLCTLPSLGNHSAIVAKMVIRSKELFIAWRKREGFEPLSIEDSRTLSEIPATDKDDRLASLRNEHSHLLASREDQLPGYRSSLRLGIVAQQRLNQAMLTLERSIENGKAPH